MLFVSRDSSTLAFWSLISFFCSIILSKTFIQILNRKYHPCLDELTGKALDLSFVITYDFRYFLFCFFLIDVHCGLKEFIPLYSCVVECLLRKVIKFDYLSLSKFSFLQQSIFIYI
jgi:hypothetical protein